MIKKEAKSSILFRHWLRANPIRYSCTFEMKDSRGAKSIPFSCLEENQIIYGMAIKSKKGTLIRNQGGNGEPDYTYHYEEPAYIVISFPDCFTIIDIETFILEKERSKKKSLTINRAKDIAIIVCKKK